LERFAPYLPSLAKVSEVEIVDEFPSTDAPVELVGDIRLMLHVEVDAAAEVERISKEIARVEVEVQKSIAKLANDSFVARAPASVVEQQRARLKAGESELEQLKVQLARFTR